MLFRWLPEYCPPVFPRMSSKTADQDQRKNRYVRFSRLEGVHHGRAKAEKRYVRAFERGGVMRYWIGFDIAARGSTGCVCSTRRETWSSPSASMPQRSS